MSHLTLPWSCSGSRAQIPQIVPLSAKARWEINKTWRLISLVARIVLKYAYLFAYSLSLQLGQISRLYAHTLKGANAICVV